MILQDADGKWHLPGQAGMGAFGCKAVGNLRLTELCEGASPALAGGSKSMERAAKNRTLRVVLWVCAAVLVLLVIGVVAIISLVGIVNVSARGGAARGAVTRATISVTTQIINAYVLRTGSPPSSIEALVPQYVEKIPLDEWQNALVYAFDGATGVATLRSLGADGKPGGTGEDADIVWQLNAQNGTWIEVGDVSGKGP